MTQQLISRFSPQCTILRSFFQRTYINTQPIVSKLRRTVANSSLFFPGSRATPLVQRVVRLNHSFPQIEQGKYSWFVLFAIALAATTLANKQSEAEEAELSWDELEQIVLLFEIDLPKTRNPEELKKAGHKCFDAVFKACLERDWALIDRVSKTILSKLTNTWGQTLLIAAAIEGNEVAVEGLIKRNIALPRPDCEDNTLHVDKKQTRKSSTL